MKLKVETPLRLRKTPIESVKTLIQEAGLLIGLDIRGYRGVKARFHKRQSVKQFAYDREASDLTGDRLAEVTRGSSEVLKEYERIQSGMSDAEFRNNAQFQTVPLIDHILSTDAKHNRVVSIASAFARAEHHLATAHPSVHFDCVDFAPELAEVNARFARDNISFHSAYPLQWLRETRHQFDIAVFNRVLCIISPAEVAAYLAILKDRTRYIVFGEQTKLHTFPFGVNLDRIPADAPLPLRHHFIYNYRAILERAGFEMVHYEGRRSKIGKEHGPQHCMIIGAARRTA